MGAHPRGERILHRLGRTPPAVVLLDGRSGSGKTVLAAQLAARLGAQTLHLDDLYPGWDGLAAGSRAVAAALTAGAYRRYEWGTAAFAERVALDAGRPLVIEGCGAVTGSNVAAARAWAERRAGVTESGTEWFTGMRAEEPGDTVAAAPSVLCVWLECPEPVRRARALARDGDMFRPHWDRWAAQEETHLALQQPIAFAAEIVHYP